MPGLTVSYPKGQRSKSHREEVDRDRVCKWMERAEHVEQEPPERFQDAIKSTQTPVRLRRRSRGQAVSSVLIWRGWHALTPAGALWAICHFEVLLDSSVLLVDTCWRLLLVCMLCLVLAGCVYTLKWCLQSQQRQVKIVHQTQENMTEKDNNSGVPAPRSPGSHVGLSLGLTDCLMLCVLQEPLADTSGPHIKGLLCRMESVSDILEKAEAASYEDAKDRDDKDSILAGKVKLLLTYLQKRTELLRRLVQVQGNFEASVEEMLHRLKGLWTQLEEQHTRVTLTNKEGSQDFVDLASARSDAEMLFAVVGHFKTEIQCCETHLKDSTQLLQEMTWSHTHASHSVSSSTESVWPELLLQSNMEQFDKVQESFLSLKQQTSTFQAHLQGLKRESRDGHTRVHNHTGGALSSPVSSQTSLHLQSGHPGDVSANKQNPTPPMSESSVDVDSERDTRLSLCEKSALHLSTTMRQIRKSGKRK
ncbi:uncharacterized protein si:ch211-151h10.2 [Thalassophryne amazonica]|uniref:uncharacterized protein si:ch211-151h10.2 n=1 Tax=Thalassophryne amazonica TaxID=390379 RepID=UPI0014708B0E|nr:uncharacterized protein si:ch211-151h10.2 [Thalassophryne amazonica]